MAPSEWHHIEGNFIFETFFGFGFDKADCSYCVSFSFVEGFTTADISKDLIVFHRNVLMHTKSEKTLRY